MRANVDDLQRRGDDWALLVHGKSHDRLVFLRPDVADALRGYLAARGCVQADAESEPLLAAVGNYAGGHRLSRHGVRHVVDSYLRAAKVKRPRVSNHALRHTGATLAYLYTHDLRAVQGMLGHQDPKTTARYARVVDQAGPTRRSRCQSISEERRRLARMAGQVAQEWLVRRRSPAHSRTCGEDRLPTRPVPLLDVLAVSGGAGA